MSLITIPKKGINMSRKGIYGFVMTLVLGCLANTAHAQTYQQYVQIWNTTWAQYQAEEAIPLPQRGVVVQSQDLPIVINANIDLVYDIYANVFNAIGLHPFLKKIIPIRYEFPDGVVTFDFIALEDIPLPDGTIFHGQTVAQQRFHECDHYYDVDSFDVPGVITHQHIVFTAIDSQHTQVVEHLTFEAPPPLIAIAVQGGVLAHQAVQAGLKANIESGALQWTPLDELIEGDILGLIGGRDH
jgi:hypothetical protein